MAGAKYRIELDDEVLRRTLQELPERATNLAPALKNIGEHLDETTRRRFDRHEAPDGTAWDPVSERYASRKRRGKAAPRGRSGDRRPGNILRLTGELKDTLRFQILGNELLFGSDRIYAATHQFGDDTRNIPSRPFLGLSDENDQSIREILNDHLQGALP